MPESNQKFLITGLGGKKDLSGSVTIGGAKNAVMPAFAASLLFETPLCVERVPAIEDVERMSELLRGVGVAVNKKDATYTLDASVQKLTPELERVSASKMRSSVFLTGPLLARTGHVRFPHPGGCVIGERPIDQFLQGFKKMGATVSEDGKWYDLQAKDGLKGIEHFFTIMSVSATETFMMAAILAKGTTVLKNAAMEPEVVSLAELLRSGGAQIHGEGTPTITIEGGSLLRSSSSYVTIPDRIETGSFLILGALTARDLVLKDCNPAHIEILIRLLLTAGVPITHDASTITISNNIKPNQEFELSQEVRTHEYPGFATDLQAPLTVFFTQITGENTVFETIFENRLGYTQDLVHMGADITMWNPHKMMVRGPRALKGRELVGPDLRAGLAFIIAALVAEGESKIGNAYVIDRGYERIEKRLSELGATMSRASA
jgi:UDP-N-acetylglucosamine 1-carboxyvinyltransferase